MQNNEAKKFLLPLNFSATIGPKTFEPDEYLFFLLEYFSKTRKVITTISKSAANCFAV
jgi:hypothetical protein